MPDLQDAQGVNRIDEIVEQASQLLGQTKAIDAEFLSLRALDLAVRASDWDRAARIVMPLQESRRLRRQNATDTGTVRLVDTQAQTRIKPETGCYLFQPPLIAADARAYRESWLRRGVQLFVLTREPMTRDGLWPVSAVGALSIRTKLAPPAGVKAKEGCVTHDEITQAIPVSWFQQAAEALGDAAIASVDASEPAAHRVLDLIERLDAFPEHEKLHQALERACQEALVEPAPKFERRRGHDDPYSF